MPDLQSFNSILEKNVQLGLRVHCSNKGCEWIGELRHLANHKREECEWVFVECRHSCGMSVPRAELVEHEQECPAQLQRFMQDVEKRYEKEVVSMREQYPVERKQN